ncbi:Ig-like domain repeat protein, partial [Methanobrevibacter sp.]|uniref:Ig-like domain repeat protein n=1 Tax=Methanobrevibacter sp. TaxID=66852 RepID=UPI00386D8E58
GKINYTFSTEGYSYGNHTVNFLYFGKSFDSDLFLESDGKTPVKYALNILPKETTSVAQSDDDNYFIVYVYDDEGNIAYDAIGTIAFFVDGVKGPVVEIVNGIARLDLSQFKNGAYLISWTYSGDNKYGPSSNSLSLTVYHKPAKISASALTALYSAGNKYSVTVYKPDGSLASGVKVTFLINNKAYKTVTTNSKGVASVVIKSIPGSYKITTKALDVSVTKNLKVKHVVSLKKVTVKKSAKKLVLTATLKKVKGKYLKKKTVTFKFNGKKYKAKTNKKGVAKVTIKSSALKKLKVGKKVKYQATYLKDTVKRTVKVKK